MPEIARLAFGVYLDRETATKLYPQIVTYTGEIGDFGELCSFSYREGTIWIAWLNDRGDGYFLHSNSFGSLADANHDEIGDLIELDRENRYTEVVTAFCQEFGLPIPAWNLVRVYDS